MNRLQPEIAFSTAFLVKLFILSKHTKDLAPCLRMFYYVRESVNGKIVSQLRTIGNYD